MEQTTSAAKGKKEYCCYKSCNLAFGLAERRVAVGVGKVMHEDCYVKHLREQSFRQQRIDKFFGSVH